MKLCFAALLLTAIDSVRGHGHLESPRSRNFFAFEEGVDTPQVGKPPKDYCAHCLNGSNDICGFNAYNDYDNYKDSLGKCVHVCIYTQLSVLCFASACRSSHQ